MASINSCDYSKKRTRLQKETEQRKTTELLREDEELKRQKKIFKNEKLIVQRDILVNTQLPSLNLKSDRGCSTTVKQETLEVDEIETCVDSASSNLLLEPKIEDCSVVTVEETLDLEELENTGQLDEESDQSEESEYNNEIYHVKKENLSKIEEGGGIGLVLKESSQNHIKILQDLINQKEQEITMLIGIVNGLQHQLNFIDDKSYSKDLKIDKYIVIDSNVNKDRVIVGSALGNAKVLTQLTSNLMEKHAKVRKLTMEMLVLQDKLFQTACHTLETSRNYKTSSEFVQESFNLILPILYTDLQFNDILGCRKVCRSWRNVTDNYFNTLSYSTPLDIKTFMEPDTELGLGRLPVWNELPRKKLIKAYRFSDIDEIQSFTDDKKGTAILGSTVSLDNLLLTNKSYTTTKLISFFRNFSVHIKSLIFYQNVESPDFTLKLLMERVKLCFKKLSNLQHFKLVFIINKAKLIQESKWYVLEAIGKSIPNIWRPHNYPKLEHLESIELDAYAEEIKINLRHKHFLDNFSNCLIEPYSQQLKQLRIFSVALDHSDGVFFPNLIQLSVPKCKLERLGFSCQHVKKLLITDHWLLSFTEFSTIRKRFPKLTCLYFKAFCFGRTFSSNYFRLGRLLPAILVELIGVRTLELENYGAITFTILDCFPDLQYIKLINDYSTCDVDDDKYLELTSISETENSLIIHKLWEGSNLYESKSFWERFFIVSLVTLEYSGKPEENILPKICTWTREGYNKYKLNNFLQ